MEVKVQRKEDAVYRPQVGDIIEFEGEHIKSTFYLICYETLESRYFMVTLSGTKGQVKFYFSIDALISAQSHIKKIYSQEEYFLSLSKNLKADQLQ